MPRVYIQAAVVNDRDIHKGGAVMKLQYIYILLGSATFVLNLALALHLFRSRNCPDQRGADDDNELITFRLARERNTEGFTTEAIRYDETLPMEEEP